MANSLLLNWVSVISDYENNFLTHPMNPTLLFCGISDTLKPAIEARFEEAVPGVYPMFFDSIGDLSKYLKSESPYSERDYPAPHFILLSVPSESVSMDALREFKQAEEFAKIPVILLVEESFRKQIEEAFSWLFSVIVQAPDTQEQKLDFIADMVSYWSRIIKLPLI